ncbi:MAG: hypothetical protein PW734_12720 [Verrucomicrobium sp.]|nr:hypothetical protein [Verrucomicrobium sp.]
MIDYEALNRHRVDVLPAKEVLFLSGPMTHCKSDLSLEASDLNQGSFDGLERALLAESRDVLNPTRLKVSFPSAEETAAAREKGIEPLPSAQAYLRADIHALLEAGVTKIVFLPPAHTVRSTAEKPEFRHWHESQGSCFEALSGLFLGHSFAQAERDGTGRWSLRDLPREEVRGLLSRSECLASLQREYGGPQIQLGCSTLPAERQAITEMGPSMTRPGTSPMRQSGPIREHEKN